MKKPFQLLSAPTAAFVGVLFLFATTPALASSACSHFSGCERKICEMERQLDIAESMGNQHKVDGLKRALNRVEDSCTDRGLKSDVREKIADSKENIAEYQDDLREAQQCGKADKVHKYQRKIAKESSKLKQLERELYNLD